MVLHKIFTLLERNDIDILGWCPVGSVFPHGEESASLALVGHPSSDSITWNLEVATKRLLHQQIKILE